MSGAKGSAWSMAVRAASHVLHRLACKARLLRYNLTLFGFYRAAPWSTTIYGRLLSLHVPCRVSMGRRCHLGDGTYFATTLQSVIRIGDDVTVNLGCVLVAVEGISIGDRVAIAEYVSIRDQEHRFAPGSGVRGQGFTTAPVEIGDNVWIGRGAYVGPGSRIGANSIIGAGSVVRGEFPPGVLIAGAPATIRKRLTPEELPNLDHRHDKPVIGLAASS
ncbi:MAG: acyltransferase [Sphingomonadales bacterium]